MKLILSLLVLNLLACQSTNLPALKSTKSKNEKLIVLHTNDHHGHFWRNGEGEWGMPARATLIKEIRKNAEKEGAEVLLLSAGDVNTGTPASDLADAKPDFIGMNYMRYDVMAVGNHEFDNELEILREQEDLANFPFLSANIYLKDSDERAFTPYIIKEVGTKRVAILGLTTDETPSISLVFPKDKLELRSPIEEAKKLVPMLRSQADMVIALTHMGHYKNGDHKSAPPGDVTLARTVPGIDLIVGGHSQNPLFTADQQNKTWIVQADDSGKYLGQVKVTLSEKSSKIESAELIPINHQSGQFVNAAKISEDLQLKKKLQPFQNDAESIMKEAVGQTTEEFIGDRSVVRYKEAPIGNLLTQIMKDATQSDLALMASGLIRTGFPKGTINFGHVLLVQPFNLEFVTVKLSGSELKNYLNEVMKKQPGDGAMPQTTGVKLTAVNGGIRDIEVNGKKISDKSFYQLAVPDFHARGGGGYPVLEDHPSFAKTSIIDAEATKAFFKRHKSVDPQSYAVRGDISRK